MAIHRTIGSVFALMVPRCKPFMKRMALAAECCGGLHNERRSGFKTQAKLNRYAKCQNDSSNYFERLISEDLE